MNMSKATIALTLLFSVANVEIQAAPAVPHGQECNEITQVELKALRNILMSAKPYALKDYADNGVSGRYAIASAYDKAGVINAIKEVNRIIAFLDRSKASNDPTITSYSEAGHVVVILNKIRKILKEGEWWATISAIYHDRNEGTGSPAFQSMLRQSEAMNYVNELSYKAKLCYVGPYLGL